MNAVCSRNYWGKAKYLSDPDLPEDKCQGAHYRACLKASNLYFGDLPGTGGSKVDRAEAEAVIAGCISSVATTVKASTAQHLEQFFSPKEMSLCPWGSGIAERCNSPSDMGVSS